ncbi:MAG: hypothetical protein MI866_05345 [Bacteroidales bacterium]|nr:hypothetical protein [Bacteroidales bacterium]
MKIKKKLLSLSFSDTLLFFGITYIMVLAGNFIYTSIKGQPQIFLDTPIWIGQIAILFVTSITWNLVNRNGFLMVSEYKGSNSLLEKIELILNEKHIKIDSNPSGCKYVKKNKLVRFLESITKEYIRIEIKNDEAMIYTKRRLLERIEKQIN